MRDFVYGRNVLGWRGVRVPPRVGGSVSGVTISGAIGIGHRRNESIAAGSVIHPGGVPLEIGEPN